jgi:hypothetical protein
MQPSVWLKAHSPVTITLAELNIKNPGILYAFACTIAVKKNFKSFCFIFADISLIFEGK